MIDWNIVLYIGMILMVFGFGLFLYSEMKIREIDRKIAENDRFIQAMLRAKKVFNQEVVISKVLNFLEAELK